MAALEDSSQGRARDRRSLFERYQEPAAGAGEQEPLTGVPVEITADGRPTDVEREAEPDRITSPFDPDDIDIESRTTTVDLLLSRLRNEMIDLAPDFQRRAGIWTEEKQSRLIESLLLRIPIPSFYAAEKEDGSWAIVDGIQRLTSIARFMDADAVSRPPLRLTGLEYLDFKDESFDDLSGKLQIRLRETEVVVHVIRRGTPEPVMFNVFARLNTGGEPLTRQEIRHALIPGRARTFLAELAESDAFREATGHSVVGDRMADREMALRFLAFRLTPADAYERGDFDGFLADAMHRINRLGPDREQELRQDFERAMRSARNIFGPHTFRKYRNGQKRKSPINKALFESVAVNLAALSDAQCDELAEWDMNGALADLLDESDFERSISVGTGDPKRVHKRFEAVGELFRDVLADSREAVEQ
ncbi:DUF262 domain-containing protein [Streptomyces olivaceus]|uniref:DUF262 domain-containing protein n=1 Tax=Streptomyces olivaceus TaxID=47716 RepID=UPI001CCB624B|nr:DUF262 domain-containing protein [Streptomyces olivaceus]MBZ6249518.1 DUF262 domain-containing protein [Streptomyces olivaceus]